jgi:glutamate synthase domain-containing protein 3
MDMTHERVIAAEHARDRRMKLQEFERKRTQHMQLSDIEKEAKEKANYLLSKAQMQLEEEEDDIKRMNELILYAKCVSIRDAQLEEKVIYRNSFCIARTE